MKGILLTLLSCLAFSVMANHDLSLYAKAEMDIVESRFSFEERQVHNVEIRLFKNSQRKISDLEIIWNFIDPVTGVLGFDSQFLKVKKIFTVDDVRVLQAVKSFKDVANPENERFAVTLHHHEIAVDDGRAKVWTAKVRHGFG